MHPLSRLGFVASLALNAGLAWWFLGRTAHEPSPLPVVRETAGAVAAASPDPQTWARLKTEDLPVLAARLRATGFPPSTIRAMVSHQIGEALAAQRRALEAEGRQRPFWQNPQPAPETRQALAQLDLEHARRYREILGDDTSEDSPLQDLDAGWHFGYLPADKAALLKPLLRAEARQRQEIMAASVGAMSGAARDRMARLEGETRAALAALLTPAELFEYDLRRSETANSLRSTLAAFDPREEEFRALFQVHHAFDQQWSPRWGTPTPEQERARGQAYVQLWEQYKAVLGPERYAEYEKATNTNYVRTSALVNRLQLPAETTEWLWSIREEYRGRTESVQRDRSLSPEARNAQFAALAQEADRRVGSLLGGEHRLEAYRQQGGAWLGTLRENIR